MTNIPPIKTRKVYSGKIIDLSVDTVRLPNGNTVELEIIRHPGGAAVVALNHHNQVCLIRQYRYIAQDWLWELPAGKIDNNEDPQLTAIRELKEEAGIAARSWQSLGYYTSSPGVFAEIVHLYLALDLETGESEHEDDEVIEVHWIDFPQARQWALDNTISDGKSALALLRAWAQFFDNPC
jgi:ADP-ribose pyrophosphatase